MADAAAVQVPPSHPPPPPPPTAAASATTATAATTTSAVTAMAAATMTAAPSGGPARQLGSAIPVGLNEASLDSPTFRAISAHFGDQVEAMERWLDGYAKSTSKMVQDLLGLEDTINSYIAKTSPGLNIADGVLDTDYTVLALKRVADLSRENWMQFLATVRRLESLSAEPIRNFLGGELRVFKDARRQLDAAQKTFDSTLARYVSQSKTKEPSALREDAFAVFETRKAYLKSSLDYCQLAPQLRCSLDKLLVRISCDVWRETTRHSGLGAASPYAARWGDEMDRVRGWCKELESSEAALKRELQAARRDIGEAALNTFKPSRELDDYSASTVPFAGSRGGPAAAAIGLRPGDESCVISEKQGWLFLRVLSGKPAKYSWIRRWYYCRDGVFGWLVAGPQGVLQGDEIGLLLCSAKPAVQEERRFCFEVKTKSQNVMLQAETQAELTEWLEVFEVAKKHAFEASLGRDNAALPGGVDPAFAITPPSIPEFSARQLDAPLGPGVGADESGGTAATGGSGGGGIVIVAAAGMAAPPPDTRASFEVGGAPRRSVTALGREEGESGREHAARLMQRLDHKLELHRNRNLSGGDGGLSGGIAGLISASHNLLPASYGITSPHLGAMGSPRPGQPPALQPVIGTTTGALAPATFARPPAATALSKNAVIASGEGGIGVAWGSGIPAVLIANYWGSNSWGAMCSARPDSPLPRTPLEDDPFLQSKKVLGSPSADRGTANGSGDGASGPKSPDVASLHRKTASADFRSGGGSSAVVTPRIGAIESAKAAADGNNGEKFPPNYPVDLRVHHAQFRLLFPTVPADEKLVLVFNASWSSYSEDGSRNQMLDGGGRIYVTADNMYFYGHQMGLVTACAVRLDIISEVTAAPGKECDFIFLHLGQAMNDTGFTRITIKTFLEDLALLHSRLNLLIDDLQAEEPMDLSGIIAALLNLEKEDYLDRRSPSAESWEEIPSNTPADDGTHSGRAVTSDRFGDGAGGFGGDNIRLMAGAGGRGGRRRQLPSKFQLPSQPVIYEPEDMQQRVAERHFEISAKACFHVLFGDKSFIFPKLYFERRAKEITQGPWQLADPGGKMQRQFRFKVEQRDMLGRRRVAEVTDTQSMDVFSDHVTYVVSHVKTPWHLPHSQDFTLVTKVVITHLAKSKCRLAIYTKVDWSRAPAFSKNLVERQAADDAVRDAEELAEVATDQVRRLGPHSRTKRAIQVYGGVGQQTQDVVFSPGEDVAASRGGSQMIKPRTLTAMVFETLRSFMESVASSLMLWAFAGLRRLFMMVSAHRILLVALALSLATNGVFTSRETSTWWAERSAAKFMGRMGVGPNVMMSKAIYLADLDHVTRSSLEGSSSATNASSPASSRDSVCYNTFRDIMNTTDMDAPYQDAGADLKSASGRAAARRLRRGRQRLGAYRHNLVVALRVVNGIEREMMQSEWENWLMDENLRCEQARMLLVGSAAKAKADDKSKGGSNNSRGTKPVGGDGGPAQKVVRSIDESRLAALQQWHDEYCGSCRADQESVLRGRRVPLTSMI